MIADSARARDVAGGIVVAALALGFWWLRIVAPVTLPQDVGRPNADLYTLYVPLYAFAYHGDEFLPTWNPHQLAGTPTIGYLDGGFCYPPSWLAAVAPVHRAIGWLIAGHFALAGVGTWMLTRTLGLARMAAFVAAVVFLANTFLFLEHLRPMYLFGLSWIPLVALAAGRVVVAPSWWRGVLLGIVVALQFSTGHVQIVCYELYLGVLIGVPVALGLAREREPGFLRRVFLAAALAGAVAVSLMAAQLWPTLEVVSRAVRDLGGLTVEQTLPMRPSWVVLRNVAAAGGLGVLLVPAALALTREHRLVVGVCAVVVLVTWAIGMGTPAYDRVFFRLPGVALFRLPQQILVIGGLAVAILAGLGVDAMIARPGRLVGLAAVASGGLVGWWLRGGFGLVTVLGFTAAGVVAIAGARVPRVAMAALAVIAALTVRERFVTLENRLMVPAANDAAFFAPPPVIGFLREHAGFDRMLVVKDWNRRFPLMEKVGSLYGLGVVQDYEPLTPAVYHRFLAGLDALNPDRPLFWGRYVAPTTGMGWRPLDLMSTRWVVVAPGVNWNPSASRFRQVYAGTDATVYENDGALPRARVVGRHRVIPDEAQAIAAVLSPSFDPRAEVVVDREPASVGPGEMGGGDAEIVAQTQATLDVRATASGPALLVVSDLDWPGWRATVDGAPTEILRANGLFRAVAVPAGTHEVRFVYASRAIRLGAAMSGATLLVLAALAARAVVRTRRGRTQAPKSMTARA